MEVLEKAWPPPHQIRRSRRARHISLSITPKNGLVLTLPLRASPEEGLYFLNSKRQWVEKHLSVLAISLKNEITMPTDIQLPALSLTYPIRYHYISRSQKVGLHEVHGRIILTGPIKTFSCCLPLVNRWLRHLAQQHLPIWLNRVSQEIQLPYNKISIRSQKTLWGSCSRNHNISLNDRLLFLPYDVVRYVLIHELCHTRYFSHGKRFWQLVCRFQPNYKTYERELRDVSKHIPFYFR